MADEIYDSTAAGTAKENIPTMSNPMDNIHGNVEDISNKASGYKVKSSPPSPPPLLPQSMSESKRDGRSELISWLQATISNPNTKDSTKKNAKEMFDKLGGEDAFMKNNGKGE